jgi:hypothetical protein
MLLVLLTILVVRTRSAPQAAGQRTVAGRRGGLDRLAS